jgi:Bacterial archaeo-eukaryotic release factor family 7
MDTISISAVKQLASLQETPAVSIYLPTHLAPDARQDAIRLKNLLERAEVALEARGMRRCEAEELLTAAGKLPDDADFWKGLSQGLAIFVTPKLFRAYRLPLAFDESFTVQQRLHIKPLLPVADYGERFLLLALSQKHVRLLEINRSEHREVAVPGMPDSKRQALNYDGVDRGEQVHSAMRGNLGKQAAVFHGQGGEKDTAKEELEQFFQVISRALEPVLRQETAPLLLAGVDYILPIFRKTSSYAHIVERHLTGNCDLLTNQQLHERSWEIMRPYFDRPRRESLEKLRAFLGTGKASGDAAEVAGAATTGKIDVLLADVNQEQLGTFDKDLGRAVICDQACNGSEDLVNLAVAETLLHGGTVFAAQPHELPDSSPLAATFRY